MTKKFYNYLNLELKARLDAYISLLQLAMKELSDLFAENCKIFLSSKIFFFKVLAIK